MPPISQTVRATADQAQAAGTYMIGQTVAVPLPQEDHNIAYWAGYQVSPNYAYLYIQVPANMSRVNSCTVFWRLALLEWFAASGKCVSGLSGYAEDTLVVEISIDDGANWTALPGSPYTGDQTNIDITPFFQKIQTVAGARVIMRWSCTTSDKGCRLIAGGYMQGNVWSK